MGDVTHELAPAFVAAWGELRVVEKAHQANAGSYSYAYADLADVVKACQPILHKHGLMVCQSIEDHPAGLAIRTRLMHTSGEDVEFGPLPFPMAKDAQSMGSWITYARRYALLAALGIATGDDDDGAKATVVYEEYQNDYTPGLRTSVEGAIAKLDEPGQIRLKNWMAKADLPAVRRQNADQLAQMIDHLMSGDEVFEPGEVVPGGQEA